MDNPVLTTTLPIVRAAKNIKINRQEIKELAEQWVKSRIKVPSWPLEFHLQTKNQRQVLDYLILLDSLNFCFWANDPRKKWTIQYQNQKVSGYFALSLALARFFRKYPHQANWKYLSTIPMEEFKNILRGRGELLFLQKRWEITHLVAQRMLNNYQGDSKKFITAAEGNAQKLVSKIQNELPLFNDCALYGSQIVYFLKRAQILVCDISGALNGKGLGKFKNLDYLTAFADYKLPQILLHWNIFEYSKSLKRKIINKKTIKAGSCPEIEIRAATIWAVEYLKQELKIKNLNLTSMQIDWILWTKAKKISIKTPHHLTKTIFY